MKLTKSALNKHLKQLSNEQLIELVKECYSSSKEMEKFLAARILGSDAIHAIYDEYYKKVKHEFFPDRGHGKLRLKEAKMAISDFERLTGSRKHSLELKLVYVEMGVDFTLSFGDIDERFYNSIASMYAEVIDAVNEDETGEWFTEYEDRLEAIVSGTHDIGWGFQEVLADLHAQLDGTGENE